MFARLVLILIWGLFIAWIGYLGLLAYRHDNFPVVSRAQLLAADVAVVAEVDSTPDNKPQTEVSVAETIWPAKPQQDLAGKKLNIENIGAADKFHGKGRYVLLL